MSIEEKQHKYEQLRGLILENEEIRDLISQRDKELDYLRHKQGSSYYTLEPKLAPKDDVKIPKENQLSDELKKSQKDRIQKARETHDKKIYDMAQKHFEQEGYNDLGYLQNIGGLNEKEVGILVEKDGVSKLTDYQKEKGLPTYLTDEKYEQIFKEKRDSFSKNIQDIDEAPRKEEVQFDQNKEDVSKKSGLESLQMDRNEMDQFMSSRKNSRFIGKGKSKNLDKEKGKSDPSDKFE